MPIEQLTFDPDGDLVLSFVYPLAKENTVPGTKNTDDASSPSAIVQSTSPHGGAGEGAAAEPQKGVDMLVSSKHLSLASPVFKAMLQGSFRESQILHSTGKVEVPLPEDNPAHFEILLNLIHGRPKRVPTEVDLVTLTGLAILVDKYQLADVVDLYKSLWAQNLKDTFPEIYMSNMEMLSWLTFAWVFKLPEEFQTVTKTASQMCSGKMRIPQGLNLPIPDELLTRIDSLRINGIKRLLNLLDDLILASSTSTPLSYACISKSFAGVCPLVSRQTRFRGGYSSACDGTMLGTLLKSASAAGLYPPPQPPYKDLNFLDVVVQITNLNIVSLCDMNDDVPWPYDAHGQFAYIQEHTNHITEQLDGLDLFAMDPL
ncbi:hypothetical protein LZ554_007463 [Drepanopeziza brunnea f. sp. 'monogermtubi']|nr:hypothetical protein LZ554_007463 [Drepanopeziza brunnea f. sp. 'monogermtubi']